MFDRGNNIGSRPLWKQRTRSLFSKIIHITAVKLPKTWLKMDCACRLAAI